jgi:hypothetical protein
VKKMGMARSTYGTDEKLSASLGEILLPVVGIPEIVTAAEYFD